MRCGKAFAAWAVLILWACGAGLGAETAAAEGKVLLDAWFEISILGQKVGYYHHREVEVQWEGRTVHRSTEAGMMRAKKDDEDFQVDRTTETWREPDGRLIRTSETTKDAAQTTTERAEVKGRVVNAAKTLNDREEKKKVPIPDGTEVMDPDERLLIKWLGAEAGKTREFTVFSHDTMQLEKETVKALGREKYELGGKTVEARAFVATRTDMPGVEARLLVSEELGLLKVSAGPMEIRRATDEEAAKKFGKEKFNLSISIPVNGRIPAWTELEKITLRIEVAYDPKGELFKTNEYARRVSGAPGKYELELLAVPAPEKCSDTLPIAPEDKEAKACLEPALMFQSDHEEIRKTAAGIIGTEKNALAAADKLCRWVYDTVAKESPKTASASALETLRSKKGDCTEHAALLCALARAAGIPAREADGVAFRGDEFGFHAWTEMYIGRRWVPVDATLDFLGLPAVSIRLGTRDGKTSRDESLAGMLSLIGKTRVQIVSATRRGETFNPQVAKEAVVVTNEVYRDRCRDFYLDISGGVRRILHGPQKGQFVTEEGLSMSVAPVPAIIRDKKAWEGFSKEFRTDMEKRGFKVAGNEVKTLPGGGLEGMVRCRGLAGVDEANEVVVELRVRTMGRRTIMVIVGGPSEMFEKNPDAVKKTFDRVTMEKPKEKPKEKAPVEVNGARRTGKGG